MCQDEAMIHERTTRKRQENRSMKIENRTPHQDGFYMPGEFEPQDGVILIWPKRPGSWPYEAKYLQRLPISWQRQKKYIC